LRQHFSDDEIVETVFVGGIFDWATRSTPR